MNTNQNDVAIAVAQALHSAPGFTGVGAARSLEYTDKETPPTIVLANWYGSDLSVTVELLTGSSDE